MDRIESASDLLYRQSHDGIISPDYQGYCISNIGDTIVQLFDIQAERPLPKSSLPTVDTTAIDNVVAVVIDGLGWDRFSCLREEIDSLRKLASKGTITPLTSTYPSETAAAMTTIFTGLQPIEHGLIGWFGLFPEDNIIGRTLPFTTLEGVSLSSAYGYDGSVLCDINPDRLYRTTLRTADISVTYFLPDTIVDSVASRRICGEPHRRGYDTLKAGFAAMNQELRDTPGRSFCQLYWPALDEVAHQHGPSSSQYRALLEKTFDQLFQSFVHALSETEARRTILLVYSDHGLIDANPDAKPTLDTVIEDPSRNLRSHLRRITSGELLYPAGSPRNMQLYAKQGHDAQLLDALSSIDRLRVISREEYQAHALFGDRSAGDLFARRAPDVLVLPRRDGFWYDDGTLDHRGLHGGGSAKEMLVPFIASPVDALR